MTNKTVKIKVRELQDVEVSHISLVKRGATRLPFRIVKHEKEGTKMIDLSTIFTKKREADPEIKAIALVKGDYSDELLKSLSDLGFTGEYDQSQDNATLIKSESYNADEVLVGIRLKNDMVVMVSELSKALDRSMDNSFAEEVTVNMVMPSVRVATEALVDRIWDSTYESMSKDETMNEISGIVDQYKSFILGAVQNVPEGLFKFESVEFSPIDKAEKTTEESTKDETVAQDVQDSDPDTAVDVEKSDTESSDAETPADIEVVKDDSTEQEVSKDEDEAPGEVEKTETVSSEFTELTTQLAAVSKSVESLAGLKSIITELSERVIASEKSAKLAMDAINGVTIGHADEDTVISDDVTAQKSVFNDALAFDGFEVV